MTSNLHPDMSGNWADAPFICDSCGKDFPEDKMYGSDMDDEKQFCSGSCVEEWEDKQRHFGSEEL